MSKLDVVIVEDEQLAAANLEKLIRKIDPEINVMARLASVEQSVLWFSNNKADLIFMDIQLGDGQSFRIFEQVKIEVPVIFTTAYDQFAIKAFKANGIAYLLKPIDSTELEEALDRYRSYTAGRPDLEALQEMLRSMGKAPEYKQRFMIQAGSRIRSVPVEEIAYFYFTERSVFLCTFGNKHYPLEYALDKLEALVDPGIFFRINRRMLVSMIAIDKIYSLSKSRLSLKLNPPFEEDVLVSFNKTPAFRAWLDQ